MALLRSDEQGCGAGVGLGLVRVGPALGQQHEGELGVALLRSHVEGCGADVGSALVRVDTIKSKSNDDVYDEQGPNNEKDHKEER